MPYMVNGVVVQKRSVWRVGFIPELLWSLLNSITYLYDPPLPAHLTGVSPIGT
jgi:hypothetical protein